MRAAPIGLAMTDREGAFTLARDTSVLTHGHPSGYLSAAYFAAVIWDLARGTSLSQAMAAADALLAREDGNAEMVAILARVRKLAKAGPPDARTIEALGGGWTGEEALAIALLCALTIIGNGLAYRRVANTVAGVAAHSRRQRWHRQSITGEYPRRDARR